MRKKRKQAHTKAPVGKRIWVKLKSGDEFVDKFKERLPHYIVFETRKVEIKSISAFTIWRQRPETSDA